MFRACVHLVGVVSYQCDSFFLLQAIEWSWMCIAIMNGFSLVRVHRPTSIICVCYMYLHGVVVYGWRCPIYTRVKNGEILILVLRCFFFLFFPVSEWRLRAASQLGGCWTGARAASAGQAAECRGCQEAGQDQTMLVLPPPSPGVSAPVPGRWRRLLPLCPRLQGPQKKT